MTETRESYDVKQLELWMLPPRVHPVKDPWPLPTREKDKSVRARVTSDQSLSPTEMESG